MSSIYVLYIFFRQAVILSNNLVLEYYFILYTWVTKTVQRSAKNLKGDLNLNNSFIMQARFFTSQTLSLKPSHLTL